MLRMLRLFRLACWRGFEHDIFTTARAAAYYSILTLFPALMVTAATLAASHETVAFLRQIADALDTMMPPGTANAVQSYFENPQNRPLDTLISALFIMLFAASGVVVTWMEGFLNAYGMQHCWHPVKERLVALLLVLLAFVPMTLATVSVAFGNQIEKEMMRYSVQELGPLILLSWQALRWLISLLTSVAVLALIYHLGMPRWQPWYRVVPGAVLTTVLWLLSSQVFGWYVVKYGTYNLIYGPLGAAIALLVWLYIISQVVLLGAEFNALIYPRTTPTTATGILAPLAGALGQEPQQGKPSGNHSD